MFIVALATLAAHGDHSTGVSCANSYAPVTQAPLERQDIQIYASTKRPLVMVALGDHPYMPATFDTGSSGNLISLQAARHLHLPENGPSPSVDGDGKPVPGFDTCLNDLEIGGVDVDDRRATAFPFDIVDEVAIISPMQFSGAILRWNGPGLKISVMEKGFSSAELSAPRDWGGSLGDAHPVVDLKLGEFQIEARLDSGADSELILPLRLMEQLDLETEPVEVGSMTSAAGLSTPIYRARLNGELRFGAVVQSHPDLLFGSTTTPLIGWPMMKDLVFYMDPANRMSYFAGPGIDVRANP